MDDQTRSILSRLKRLLQSTYGARLRETVLFGSYARQTAQPSSDIDVLVVLAGPVSPGDEIARTGAAVADLSLQTNKVISLVFMDEERYLHRAGPLLRNVRREGVVV